MKTEYNTDSQFFDFCADQKVYKKLNNVEKENAICFIYQPDKPRRCSMVGIEALGIVKFLRPDIKIYLYGSTIKGNVWFEHENLGIIPIEKCNELYNKCSVGLCISSSNPSRIPFEMMAAGLPVVDLFMENNLYDMPEVGVSLAHYTPESIAKALIDILDDKDKAKQMSEYGQEYMKDKDLVHGYKQFYEAVKRMVTNTVPSNDTFEKLYNGKPVVADVMMNQKLEDRYEAPVMVDNSLLGKLKRVRFIRKSKLIRKIWYKFTGI